VAECGIGNIHCIDLVDRILDYSRGAFELNLDEFLGFLEENQSQKPTRKQLRVLWKKGEELFERIDFNKNETLEPEEMMNSLILLTEGSPDDKIEAAFMIFDLNHNKCLEWNELLRYFHNVCNMVKRNS